MKKLVVSLALFAFVTAMSAPTIIASSGKACMMQQDNKKAQTDKKTDKKCDKACTKDKGSCNKDKKSAAAPADKK